MNAVSLAKVAGDLTAVSPKSSVDRERDSSLCRRLAASGLRWVSIATALLLAAGVFKGAADLVMGLRTAPQPAVIAGPARVVPPAAAVTLRQD